MQRKFVETMMGGLVLVVALFFFFWAWGKTSEGRAEKLVLTVKTVLAEGVRAGSEVRIGGVKVGIVSDIDVDVETYQAVLTLSLRGDLRLADDSSLTITSDGFLGGAFLDLIPGRAENHLGQGGEIKNVNPMVSLEDMLGRAIFIVTEEAKP